MRITLATALTTTVETKLDSYLGPKGTVITLIQILAMKTSNMDLSFRSGKCLDNGGIEYVYQLIEKTEADMLKSKNFGHKSLKEIREELGWFDLRFGCLIDSGLRDVLLALINGEPTELHPTAETALVARRDALEVESRVLEAAINGLRGNSISTDEANSPATYAAHHNAKKLRDVLQTP